MAAVTLLPLPPSSPDPVRLLTAAVDAVAAQSPAGLPEEAALRRTQVLMRESERLRVLALQAVADVDTRELFTLDGAGGIRTWVDAQQVGGIDRGQVTLARRLRDVPLVAAEVAAGRLGLRGAQDIASALAATRPHLDRPDGRLDGQDQESVLQAVIVDGCAMLVAEAHGGAPAADPDHALLRAQLQGVADDPLPAACRLEGAFVILATRIEPGLLRSALARLVGALLPLQLEDAAARAHERRRFELSRGAEGSGWRVSAGELDDECGELLWTVLQAEMATDPDNPDDTAAHAALRETGDLRDGLRPRSRLQRQHDALKLGLRRLLDSGVLGTRVKARPHLDVLVGLDTLAAAPGALPARSGSGAALALTTVRRWLCDSELTRMVLGAGSRVTESSHTARTLKAHERRALQVQWGGRCAGAGCVRGPGHPLVPHHVQPFWQAGTTSVADTVPLCDQEHHDLHEGGRRIQLKDGRWIGPDGWVP